jgi:hypothetical protein
MHPIHYQYLHTAAADGALEPGEYTTRHQDLGMTSWYTVRAVRQTKPRADRDLTAGEVASARQP